MIGFRTTFDVFPDEIYYRSTKEEMEKFYAKFPQDDDIPNGPGYRQDEAQEISEPKLDPTIGSSKVIVAQPRAVDIVAAQQSQEAQVERHEDLKRELQISREQMIVLQEQLQMLQNQMSCVLTALKATS